MIQIYTSKVGNILSRSINVTYLQGDDDMPALGDLDRSDPWICDELVYMLQTAKQVCKNWRHKYTVIQAFD